MIKNNLKLKLSDYYLHDELLYINNRLYVLNIPELRIKIIRGIYNSSLEGYTSRLLIYNRLSRYYYWLRIMDSVTRYIKSCHIYKRFKTYREGK